jgi:long-subunit acyl-CoA synthetase (AMP-forming)
MIHTLSGAALMDAELAKQVEAKLHCTVSQTWGMSETTGSVTLSPWDTSVTDGSLSPLLANMRLRIVDYNEVDVAEGQVGEFLVSGPMVTPGYWKDGPTTREAFTSDGAWLRTGDLGYVRDGKIFHRGPEEG